MTAAKAQDTDFSQLMKDLSTKMKNLNTQSQPAILELLAFVKEEIASLETDYVPEEASEERKLYNTQVRSAEIDLKKMSTKLGPIYKAGDELPENVKTNIKEIEKEILDVNLFAGHVRKDKFGRDVRSSFRDRVDYLMTQARIPDGLYTVDANHQAIKNLRVTINKAKFDSMIKYLRDGKRTIALDNLCRSIISNKSQSGEDLKYPFSDIQVQAVLNALESRKPTK